jgi:hypothetical protein
MVVDELSRNPRADLGDLYARAREIDSSIGELSLRQVHGRYPLQAKRIAARGRPKTQRATKRGGSRKQAAGRVTAEAQAVPRRGGRNAARRGAANGAGSQRAAIRSVLLEFASAFAEAESRPEIVRVLSSVDGYVERVESGRVEGSAARRNYLWCEAPRHSFHVPGLIASDQAEERRSDQPMQVLVSRCTCSHAPSDRHGGARVTGWLSPGRTAPHGG